jgi:hypothetical protein
MPFGLTNASPTFQALMNDVLWPFLHKFVLVFFDDILVFSRSWSEHLQHVKQVFQALRDQSWCSSVPSAPLAQSRWPTWVTSSQRQVWSWTHPRWRRLQLGYLRAPCRCCGVSWASLAITASSLTALLKKEAFKWMDDAEEAFQLMKQALMMAPLLQMPDFNKHFIID